MSGREHDWLRQADADLAHARASLAAGHHEWACFAGLAGGAPTDFYTRDEAERALGDAEAVLGICRGMLSRA